MDSSKAPRGVTSVGKGLNSLTLDPSLRMRALCRTVDKRNTVEQAWHQVGRVIRDSMGQVRPPAPR